MILLSVTFVDTVASAFTKTKRESLVGKDELFIVILDERIRTVSSALQPENALLLIFSTESGIMIFWIVVQFENAPVPIDINDDGKLIVFMPVAPRNVYAGTETVPSAKLTVSSAEQPLNTPLVVPFGSVSVEGIVISVRAVQPWNALVPSFVMPS